MKKYRLNKNKFKKFVINAAAVLVLCGVIMGGVLYVLDTAPAHITTAYGQNTVIND